MFSDNFLNRIANFELKARFNEHHKEKWSYKHEFLYSQIASLLQSNLEADEICSFLLDTNIKFSLPELFTIFDRLEKDFIKQKQLMTAYKTRSTRHSFSISSFKKNKRLNVELIWAYLEKGDFESASTVCEKLRHKALLKINKDKFAFLNSIICCDEKSLKRIPKRYKLVLQNDKISVYGPLFDGEYFDRDSTNVTIGYKGKGNKPNISYYNVEASSKINELKDKSFFEDLDMAVFFKKQFRYQKELSKNNRFRYIYTVDYLFDFGQPNMLQNMVFHILRNRPRSLYLSGFNLYLSKTIYGKNYNDYKQSSNKLNEVVDSFAEHNIISQYQFMHFLYQKKFFKADDNLDRILKMGIKSFLLSMEKLINED